MARTSKTRRRGQGRERLAILAFAGIVAATACATREADPAETAPQARSAEPELAARTGQRGRVIGGERIRRAVAPLDPARTDAAASARYAAAVRDDFARSPVPVLAPPDPSDRATLTIGRHWYALSIQHDGFVISTHGSAEARVHPHVRAVEPTHPMRVAGGFLTRNDGIWAASWIEGGAAYSLEIECDRRKVAWCDDEAEVLRRVESLVYVGPGGA